MIQQMGSAFTQTGDAGFNNAVGLNVKNFDNARQAKDLAFDVKRLITSNKCGGASLRRFQQNLIAFATDKPPIRMAGIPSSGPFRESDYQTLLDDLVAEQSNTWLINRFQRDSIANVAVGVRDPMGRPTSVSANYAYQAAGKQAEGSVELRFENGSPHCLVYADVPGTCRSINPIVIAAYEDGKYVTEHPAVARTYVAPDLRQIKVVVDQSPSILVEIPGDALHSRRDIVVATRGKLLRDVQGIGPDGSVVLVHAGGRVLLSISNTQRSTKINLGQIGVGTSEAIDFHNTFKELGALPNDGSPLRVSFDVPSGIQRTMLVTDFQKQKTVMTASASTPTVAGRALPSGPTSGEDTSSLPRAANLTEARRVLLAGTLFELQFRLQESSFLRP